jgi:DNA-binding MarR family transcriptional regulator
MNKELAARLGVSEGQSSKLVSAAVAAGKLSKQVDPANRRAVLIRAAA